MPIQTYRPSISKTPAYGNLINKDCPLNRGIVSNWLTLPLLKGRPKFTDIAGGYDGTFNGYGSDSPWRGAMGRPGGFGSTYFDGISDRVEVPSNTSIDLTGPLTLSAWVYSLDTTSDYRSIAGKEDWTNFKGYYLGINPAGKDGGVYFGFNRGGNEIETSASVVAAGAWSHLTGTFDGIGLKIYINGIPFASGGNSTTPVSNSSSLFLAYVFSGSSSYTTVVLDDVSIFNRALSANEIYALYEDSRRGYPQRLNWLSGTSYFVGGGGTPTYTATIAATVGAVTAAASATFTKPTYTAAISGTTGPSSAAVAATFTKPTYTATVAAAAGHATAAVAATFAKPTYTAAVSAVIGPATAAVLATFAKPTYTAAVVATTGHATAAVLATFAKPTYAATVQAASPPATASALVTFSADANVATIVAVVAPAVAQAYVTFTVSVPPGRFIVDQVSFADPVDSVEFSYPVDSVTF